MDGNTKQIIEDSRRISKYLQEYELRDLLQTEDYRAVGFALMYLASSLFLVKGDKRNLKAAVETVEMMMEGE